MNSAHCALGVAGCKLLKPLSCPQILCLKDLAPLSRSPTLLQSPACHHPEKFNACKLRLANLACDRDPPCLLAGLVGSLRLPYGTSHEAQSHKLSAHPTANICRRHKPDSHFLSSSKSRTLALVFHKQKWAEKSRLPKNATIARLRVLPPVLCLLSACV